MSSLGSRQEVFQDLVERHVGILFRVARTYCRNAEDQRDLIQEIRVNLWLAFPKYDPSRAFPTWMYRIALNTAISWARKAEVRTREIPPPSPAPEPEDDKARVLHQLIAELDQMNRALLLLYMDELSYAEIGEVLGITESNVGVRINRLKQQLREQIKREEQN